MELFSRPYIGYQTKGGKSRKTLNSFSHENQVYPPAMSDGGKLHLCNLLACLIDHSEYQSDASVISAVMIKEAVIAQMWKPAVVQKFDEYGS